MFLWLLISAKNKVLRPSAGLAESNSKSQYWYPEGTAWSMISVHCSGENIYPNGGHALAGFYYAASAGLLTQNIFRLEALNKRLWNLKNFFH